MTRGNHLWEVNERELLLLVHQHVELVEVAVDQAVSRQTHDHLHTLPVDHIRVSHLPAP